MNVESIKAKLKNYSKEHNKTHQYTVTRFMQERFLYRLSKSDYRNNFLLKGGALVYIYGVEESRFTKDIDFLAKKIDANNLNLSKIFKEIACIDFDDGLKFDSETVKVDEITKEGSYTGTRIKILGVLGNMKQYLQIDIGVGDYVTPGPQEVEYPTILPELDRPILVAYSKESMISEKFEAMISLGEYNSRMKDFYDIYNLVEDCDSKILVKAIENTFSRRSTKMSLDHPVFLPSFYSDPKRLKQWKLFLKKNELEFIPFDDVYKVISANLEQHYEEVYKRLKK